MEPGAEPILARSRIPEPTEVHAQPTRLAPAPRSRRPRPTPPLRRLLRTPARLRRWRTRAPMRPPTLKTRVSARRQRPVSAQTATRPANQAMALHRRPRQAGETRQQTHKTRATQPRTPRASARTLRQLARRAAASRMRPQLTAVLSATTTANRRIARPTAAPLIAKAPRETAEPNPALLRVVTYAHTVSCG